MPKIEIYNMLASIHHFIIELLLGKSIKALISNDGIFATLAIAIKISNTSISALVCPILQYIGRAIDILSIQISLMDSLAVSLKMIILIGEPIGIDMP